MITATEAVALLREGNDRFATGRSEHAPRDAAARRNELLEGQEPFAVVLGCSDSRVPVEIVFDRGLGDLFVIRVAGNVVAPSQVGSVEFAAERFGTRLVVVLGHTGCGAVRATVDALHDPGGALSRNLHSIVERIRPAVDALVDAGVGDDPAELARRAVRANVRFAANHLRHGSQILENLVRDDGLLVVGAEYDLATGRVDFFDGL